MLRFFESPLPLRLPPFFMAMPPARPMSAAPPARAGPFALCAIAARFDCCACGCLRDPLFDFDVRRFAVLRARDFAREPFLEPLDRLLVPFALDERDFAVV